MLAQFQASSSLGSRQANLPLNQSRSLPENHPCLTKPRKATESCGAFRCPMLLSAFVGNWVSGFAKLPFARLRIQAVIVAISACDCKREIHRVLKNHLTHLPKFKNSMPAIVSDVLVGPTKLNPLSREPCGEPFNDWMRGSRHRFELHSTFNVACVIRVIFRTPISQGPVVWILDAVPKIPPVAYFMQGQQEGLELFLCQSIDSSPG